MQISKSLFVVCATAVILSFSASAADTPAQAKAREALEQKYKDVDSRTAPAVSQPPAKQPAPAPVAPRPAVRKPALQDAPAAAAPAVQPADSESITRAREALRKKMAELEASPQAGQEDAGFADVPSGPGTEAAKIEAARAAVDRETKLLTEQQQKEAEQKAALKAEAAQGIPAPLRGMREYETLQGPPLPFTAQQQQKLAELLRKYRADEITPDQYHAERARIIAEK